MNGSMNFCMYFCTLFYIRQSTHTCMSFCILHCKYPCRMPYSYLRIHYIQSPQDLQRWKAEAYLPMR